MRDYAEQEQGPDPVVVDELRRRQRDYLKGLPPHKWASMNRAERRAYSRKGGKL